MDNITNNMNEFENLISNPENDSDVKFEHDKYVAIALLSVNLLFEYDVNADTMLNMVNRNGRFEKSIKIPDFSNAMFDSGLFSPDDEGILDVFIRDLRSDRKHVESEVRLFVKSRDRFEWCRLEGERVISDDGKRNVVTGRIVNIDDEKAREKEQRERALRDPLTGMYIRDAAAKRVEQCVEARRNKEVQALFLVDIENFSVINKTMGRVFGDEVLKNLASDIRREFYDTDVMGRVGVDRFIVLMRDAGGVSNIMHKATQLSEIMDNTYVGENSERMRGCIGVSVAPIDGTSFETLLEKADKAMFYARNHVSNRVEIYDQAKEDIYQQEYAQRKDRKDYIPVIELAGGGNGGDSLIQLAFKLIEETKDADSAINMLIRRMAQWLNLSKISILEITEEPYTLKHMYEYGRYDGTDRLGHITRLPKTVWDKMLTGYSLHQGMCVRDKETPYEGFKEYSGEFEDMKNCAIVQCAFYEGGEYLGCVNYIDLSEERVWQAEEQNVMGILTNIIFSYMLKMRAFQVAKEQVEKLSEYDQVTGLLKFDRFKKMAENYVMSSRANRFVIVYSDIYNFKYVNERYGYDAGDVVLKCFAERVLRNTREGHMCCRSASDNFITFSVCPFGDTKEELDSFVAKVRLTNADFSEEMHNRYEDSNLIIVSGICVFDRRYMSFMKAVSYANLARKRAKTPGQDSCIVYTEQMGMEIMRRSAYLSEVTMALTKREFVVFLQPKVDAATGRIVGSEALVRWRKSDGTLIFPGEFIPVFEENRMIKELDFYVYEEVFKYLAGRIKAGKKIVPVSVNASRVHLANKNELRNYLAMLLDKYDIPSEYIEVELTEDIMINDMSGVVEIINSIREMGIKVSLDDFGSGYSSLNVLRRIPIDVLKLDKVFMDDMDNEDIIVNSIIKMSKRLGLKVLCEGVETRQQVQFLVDAGCDMIQGYFFSKPVDIGSFDVMLEKETIIGSE